MEERKSKDEEKKRKQLQEDLKDETRIKLDIEKEREEYLQEQKGGKKHKPKQTISNNNLNANEDQNKKTRNSKNLSPFIEKKTDQPKGPLTIDIDKSKFKFESTRYLDINKVNTAPNIQAVSNSVSFQTSELEVVYQSEIERLKSEISNQQRGLKDYLQQLKQEAKAEQLYGFTDLRSSINLKEPRRQSSRESKIHLSNYESNNILVQSSFKTRNLVNPEYVKIKDFVKNHSFLTSESTLTTSNGSNLNLGYISKTPVMDNSQGYFSKKSNYDQENTLQIATDFISFGQKLPTLASRERADSTNTFITDTDFSLQSPHKIGVKNNSTITIEQLNDEIDSLSTLNKRAESNDIPSSTQKLKEKLQKAGQDLKLLNEERSKALLMPGQQQNKYQRTSSILKKDNKQPKENKSPQAVRFSEQMNRVQLFSVKDRVDKILRKNPINYRYDNKGKLIMKDLGPLDQRFNETRT